ncbi:hypothetical protein [Naasia sp. SYSU D00948]|uniref:hypothetical protein n=1 Tax=Naasia sp. SYSU D00948 TaxID=2817379 RepID=UPI001B313177|nr:hypothetical protein [Naasia sp. SYSU D00948]
MRVLLKLTLDCEPEAAWRAVQSPAVLREVYTPLVKVDSLEPGGFPNRWEEGAHPVRMKAAGIVPLGDQVIALEFPGRRHEGVQMMRDHGGGLTGLSSLFTEWDHRIAISRHPDDPAKTLYREQLRYSAGPWTAAAWPALWGLWQFRAARLKQLAPTWSSRLGEPEFPGD